MLALNEPEVKAADLKKIYHGCLWADPSEIIDNPYNPRDLSAPVEMSRLKDLAKSISEYGLWQYPLATRIHGYDGMVLLAGHRRVCAIREFLKWPIIPYHPSEWHGLPAGSALSLFSRTPHAENMEAPHSAGYLTAPPQERR